MNKLYTLVGFVIKFIENVRIEYEDGLYAVIFLKGTMQRGIVRQSQIPAKPEYSCIRIDELTEIYHAGTNSRNAGCLRISLNQNVYWWG